MTICRIILSFARVCRVGVWFDFGETALLLAVGTCIVLSFEAMPGLCCFLRVTQQRLTQDHVLKSLCCYAVPDAIIYWHIADIHSIRTVLIERLATAVTHWPSPRSMICQRVPVDINVQRPNCLNRGRSHETYLHHPYLCDTCTFSAVPPSGAHACGKKECNDG